MTTRIAFSCLAGAALLTACAATSGAPSSTAATPSDPDRVFYEARCGVCHVPFRRLDFRPAEWPALVDQMAPRAGLSASQRARVLRYLTAR